MRCCICWPRAGGYLLGSIPFGLLLGKLAGYGDIRRVGSRVGIDRNQRPAHRQQPLHARHVAARRRRGCRGGCAGDALGRGTALIAATAAVLGTHFPVWLASAVAREWQRPWACCWRWPGRRVSWPRHRSPPPPPSASRRWRHWPRCPGAAPDALARRPPRAGGGIAGAARLRPPPRQYRSPAARRRSPYRARIGSGLAPKGSAIHSSLVAVSRVGASA